MTEHKPLTETTLRNYEYSAIEDDIGDGFSYDDVLSAVEGLNFEFCMYAQSNTGKRGCVTMGECLNCHKFNNWFPVFKENGGGQ